MYFKIVYQVFTYFKSNLVAEYRTEINIHVQQGFRDVFAQRGQF